MKNKVGNTDSIRLYLFLFILVLYSEVSIIKPPMILVETCPKSEQPGLINETHLH